MLSLKNIIFLLTCLFFEIGFSQKAILLKDCLPGTHSSEQKYHVSFLNHLYFSADDGKNGDELWKSDGTANGTIMVKNIGFEQFRSKPKALTVFKNMIFFTANDEKHGNELWKSDGTELGTVLLKDINSGLNSSQPTHLTASKDHLYFIVQDSKNKCALWSTDGSSNNTKEIENLGANHSISKLISISEGIYVLGKKEQHAVIWFYDFKEQKLLKLHQQNNVQLNTNTLALIDNDLVYSTQNKEKTSVWTFGFKTKKNTLLKEILNPHCNILTWSFNNQIFWASQHNGIEIWQADNSSFKSKLIKTLSKNNDSLERFLVKTTKECFYLIHHSSAKNNTTKSSHLWQYNLKNEWLQLIELPHFNQMEFYPVLEIHQQRVYFSKQNKNGQTELMVIDQNKTQNIVIFNKNNSVLDIKDLIVHNKQLLAVATDDNFGTELWKIEQNLQAFLVKDINSKGVSSAPMGLSELNKELCFFTLSKTKNLELWTSNGKTTSSIKNIPLDIEEELEGTYSDGKTLYFFIKNNLTKSESLWKSNGTVESTVFLKTFNYYSKNELSKKQANIQYSKEMIVFKNEFYFTVYQSEWGTEIWKTNGTSNGTILLKDIYKGSESSNPEYFTVFKNQLFFSATTYNEGTELWVSDGSINGTKQFKDVWYGAGSSEPSRLAVSNDYLFFSASNINVGDELWKTDGTANGTVMVKDINTGEDNSSINDLYTMNNKVYFSANNGKHGVELWVSDGTEKGTFMLKDIYAGEESSSPSSFILFNNLLIFEAKDHKNGFELWKTDGTEKGSKLISDLRKGINNSFIKNMTYCNGYLFFSASNLEIINALWYLNKNHQLKAVEGDFLSTNIEPPSQLIAIGNVLYFVVDDFEHGQEVWKLEIKP